MRLFIRSCNRCGKRINLSVIASNRGQLANRIGHSFEIQCPHCQDYSFHTVDEVFAEPNPPSTPAGAILGGLVGLIGGPPGMLIGGVLGTLWGVNVDEGEKRSVDRFNRS